MVWTTKTYHCDKCSAPFATYEAAERCETNHIVRDAVQGFESDLDRISKSNVARRRNRHD